MSEANKNTLIIPHILLPDINKWSSTDVETFLKANKDEYQLADGHISAIRTAEVNGRAMVRLAEQNLRNCGLPEGPALCIVGLIDELKKAKVLRKPDPMRRRRAHPTPLLKRTRIGSSTLVIGDRPLYYQSGPMRFQDLLQREGQVYFDRTGYIAKLEKLHPSVLFCRPCRFGKSLTISMLEHFHGLQYAGEHDLLYENLDISKDIGTCKPGCYFILKFDFSTVSTCGDLKQAGENLIQLINNWIWVFYDTYATYLHESTSTLRQKLSDKNPIASLHVCLQMVSKALKELDNVHGVYLLVDEYDSFANDYLQPYDAPKDGTTWIDTDVGRTFKGFWSTVKSFCTNGPIKRSFITGISPLSLTNIGSAFHVSKNLSFNKSLAGLCGLTRSELESVLKKIHPSPQACDKHLKEMAAFFSGYHFCRDQGVDTVYNTETCLEYFQDLVEGNTPNPGDPQNSEISTLFLKRFAVSSPFIAVLQQAFEDDGDGSFKSISYSEFKSKFTLEDLSRDNESSWRSLLIYYGGLTFDFEKPNTHFRIPNKVVFKRIATAVLEEYRVASSLRIALQNLISNGIIKQPLSCYHDLMVQRDRTVKDLTEKSEENHRDTFYFCLRLSYFLSPSVEFKVKKSTNTPGYVNLLFQVSGWLIITEWKSFRIDCLDIPGKTDPFSKAAALCDYTLNQILETRFGHWDKYHRGTIRDQVTREISQLASYVKDSVVQEMKVKGELKIRAHLVIIVGSRHILLWDMNSEGNLADEPCLVGGYY